MRDRPDGVGTGVKTQLHPALAGSDESTSCRIVVPQVALPSRGAGSEKGSIPCGTDSMSSPEIIAPFGTSVITPAALAAWGVPTVFSVHGDRHPAAMSPIDFDPMS